MEHVLHVLSHHSQIFYANIHKIMSNVRKWSSRSQGKVASTLLKFPEKKWSTGMRCDNLCSDTIALFGNDAFIQFAKLAKSGNWHCHLQWQCTRSCVTYMMQEGYQWKGDECSLLICHMQIFKSIDFRTMGLWNGLPLFWYTLYRDTLHCLTALGRSFSVKISNRGGAQNTPLRDATFYGRHWWAISIYRR